MNDRGERIRDGDVRYYVAWRYGSENQITLEIRRMLAIGTQHRDTPQYIESGNGNSTKRLDLNPMNLRDNLTHALALAEHFIAEREEYLEDRKRTQSDEEREEIRSFRSRYSTREILEAQAAGARPKREP